MPETENLGHLLALKRDSPDISPHNVSRLTRQQYGLKGKFQSLAGERDCNFLFHADDGHKLILIFSHPAEEPAVLDFQCRALVHIAAQDPDLPVPRVYPTLNGDSIQAVDLANGELARRLQIGAAAGSF